jgi:hypothetical protein
MSEAEIHAVANQIATETAARLYAVLLDGGALPILDSQEHVVLLSLKLAATQGFEHGFAACAAMTEKTQRHE